MKHNTLFQEDEVDQKGLQGVFMKLMAVNPTLECYLLDTEGNILGYDAPPEKILRERVDIEPIRNFIEVQPECCVVGDDPRSLTDPNIFSAAPVEVDGELKGYVYAILASEQYSSLARIAYT